KEECDSVKNLTPSHQQSSSDVASVKNLTHATPDLTEWEEEQAEENNKKAAQEPVSKWDQEEESRENNTPDDEVSTRTDPHSYDNTPLNNYGGREAAENYRKKHLEYSDQVKEFFNQLKKTSDIAEHLVNNREELYKSIAEMKSDGMSITVLASAVVQACDIYVPRINQARDILSDLLKPGIKGVAVREKFVVVNGGKGHDG
ncbi:MAG: hypothetical protein ACOY46_12565, partial [Bacillota bacterium]